MVTHGYRTQLVSLCEFNTSRNGDKSLPKLLPEAPLAHLVTPDSPHEVDFSETRPVNVQQEQLAISRLPHKEVA